MSGSGRNRHRNTRAGRIVSTLFSLAAIIERACTNVLASGLRTADVMAPGCAKVSTSVMGEAVVRELDKLGS